MTDKAANQGLRTALSPAERRLGLVSASLLAVVLLLFYLVRIDSAVIASGQAVVQGSPRSVQSLEGGIAHEIRVSDGDAVAAGDILIQLDSSLLMINRDIILGRLTELTARRSRLSAEAQGLAEITPADPPPMLDSAALQSHLTGQREIFLARRAVLQSREAQLLERIRQYDNQIIGLEAQIEATQSQIDYVAYEVENLRSLNERGLVPESRLLELQGRLASLYGQIAVQRSEMSGTRNSIQDARLKITQASREFSEQVATELREVITKTEENRLELASIDNRLATLDIRAPVSGIVHEMQIATEGGVVPPQQTLLTVIPVADGVEFDLQVAPDAIDVVYAGQEARVRFPGFDQRTTPELTGQISKVSPDSVVDRATGRTFYRVEVTVSPAELARLGGTELIPGMPVEAFLQTGSRSILSYLVKPFTDQMAQAFRES